MHIISITNSFAKELHSTRHAAYWVSSGTSIGFNPLLQSLVSAPTNICFHSLLQSWVQCRPNWFSWKIFTHLTFSSDLCLHQLISFTHEFTRSIFENISFRLGFSVIHIHCWYLILQSWEWKAFVVGGHKSGVWQWRRCHRHIQLGWMGQHKWQISRSSYVNWCNSSDQW